MGRLNRETDYKSLTTLLNHVLTEWAKANIHTAMPGILESYDAEARRARVQPALHLVLSDPDDPTADGETMERAIAVNVPVLWPAGGGITMAFALAQGDRGTLFFSERGITEFKKTGEISTPDRARFFDESDAFFYPGDFGHPDLTPATLTGATIQTYDGSKSVRVEPGAIELHADDAHVRVEPQNIVVDAPGDVTLNAGGNVYLAGDGGKRLVTVDFLNDYYNGHTHTSAASGSPTTAPIVKAPKSAGSDITDKTRAN